MARCSNSYLHFGSYIPYSTCTAVAVTSIILHLLVYSLSHSVLLSDNAMYKLTKVTPYSTPAQSKAVFCLPTPPYYHCATGSTTNNTIRCKLPIELQIPNFTAAWPQAECPFLYNFSLSSPSYYFPPIRSDCSNVWLEKLNHKKKGRGLLSLEFMYLNLFLSPQEF